MPLDQPPNPIVERVEESRMSFGDHLEELRMRLLLALAGPLLVSAVTLYYGRSLVSWLQRPLAQVQAALDLPTQTYAFTPLTGFAVYMKVSLVTGLIVAFPWIAYQLWKFVESGLYAHERRVAYIIAPFSAVMSVLGVLFLYYLLLPISLAFFLFFNSSFPPPDVPDPGEGGLWQTITGLTIRSSGFDNRDENTELIAPPITVDADTPPMQLPMLLDDPAEPVDGQVWIKLPEHELRTFISGKIYRYLPFQIGSSVQSMLGLNDYINLVALLALGVVVAFQLPVVMLILGWSGFIDPRWLGRYRKYCVFGCAAIGAILTPADPISMLVLAIPLYALFELGLLLMRLAYHRPTA